MLPDAFSISVALRNLRSSPGLTALTVIVVGVSVTLIIFLSSLITGLQKRLIATTTDSIAHVVIRPSERDPVALWEMPGSEDAVYTGSRIRYARSRSRIDGWTAWDDRLPAMDDRISAVSPTCEGQAIFSRGAREVSVQVSGIIPERHLKIVNIQEKLRSGRFYPLNSGEVVLGYKLAEEFGIALGDKIRLLGPEGRARILSVVGIFETGAGVLDEGTVYTTLRDAQGLFSMGRAITGFSLKMDRIFEAENLATVLSTRVPFEVQSWMERNQRLLSGLRAQSSSSTMIVGFTAIAACFAIASIMIMAVVSRLQEIGVLKAIGATQQQIVWIFAIQGVSLSFLGAAGGSLVGGLLCQWLGSIPGSEGQLFPILLTRELITGTIMLAIIVGLIASIYPSIRAATVNPIEVISGR